MTPMDTLMDPCAPLHTPLEVLPGVTIRLLPSPEWHRLSEASGVLSGHVIPESDDVRVVVAEQADRIVAYWVISAVVHLDPLFIEPHLRHHPKLILGLVGLLVTTLQALHVRYAYAIIGDADQPENGTLAEKLGLSRLPGSLYGGVIPAGSPERLT